MAKKSFTILGLGKFGTSVALELTRSGAEVLAVDKNEERVAAVADYVARAMVADVCDTVTMATLGLSNMDGVVVAITGDLNASVMGTILATEAKVPYILAKSYDEIHTKILEKVGATKIIVPEKESGVRIARSMASGNFLDFFELSDRIRMVEMAPKGDWIGKTLRELNLPKRENAYVIAMRKGGELFVGLDPDKAITKDCTLIITIDRRFMPRLMGD